MILEYQLPTMELDLLAFIRNAMQEKNIDFPYPINLLSISREEKEKILLEELVYNIFTAITLHKNIEYWIFKIDASGKIYLKN